MADPARARARAGLRPRRTDRRSFQPPSCEKRVLRLPYVAENQVDRFHPKAHGLDGPPLVGQAISIAESEMGFALRSRALQAQRALRVGQSDAQAMYGIRSRCVRYGNKGTTIPTEAGRRSQRDVEGRMDESVLCTT